MELHRTAVITGRRHVALVFTSPRSFPRSTRAIGRLVRALDPLLDALLDAHAGCPSRRSPARHQMRLSRALVKLHHAAEGRHAPAGTGLSVASGIERQLAERIAL